MVHGRETMNLIHGNRVNQHLTTKIKLYAVKVSRETDAQHREISNIKYQITNKSKITNSKHKAQ